MPRLVSCLVAGLAAIAVPAASAAPFFDAPFLAFDTAAPPSAIATGDFDRDGRTDLAAATTAGTVVVLRGLGARAFAIGLPRGSAPRRRRWSPPTSTATAILDLATAHPSAHSVSILIGRGDGGTFAPRVDVPAGIGPRSLAAGDLDRDGRVDLAVADHDGYSIRLLLNSGGGALHDGGALRHRRQARRGARRRSRPRRAARSGRGQPRVRGEPGLGVPRRSRRNVHARADLGDAGELYEALAVGDVTGDQVPDLVVGNTAAATVSVLGGRGRRRLHARRGLRRGTRAPRRSRSAISTTTGPRTSRSRTETSTSPLAITTLTLDSAAAPFGAPAGIVAGPGPVAIAALDVDGDARTDLVSASPQRRGRCRCCSGTAI